MALLARARIATMSDKYDVLRSATARALFETPGKTSPELRQAVAAGTAPPELAALVEKIHSSAYTVTDQDLDVLRQSYTEDQLFEIIVAAAFGAAEQRLAAARRALEMA
jgi:alkylhydroperoxidase family enzyme